MGQQRVLVGAARCAVKRKHGLLAVFPNGRSNRVCGWVPALRHGVATILNPKESESHPPRPRVSGEFYPQPYGGGGGGSEAKKKVCT